MNLSNIRQRPLFKNTQRSTTSQSKLTLLTSKSNLGSQSQYFTSTQHTLTSSPHIKNTRNDKKIKQSKYIETEPQQQNQQYNNYDSMGFTLDRKLKTQQNFSHDCQIGWDNSKFQQLQKDKNFFLGSQFLFHTQRESLNRKFTENSKQNLSQVHKPNIKNRFHSKYQPKSDEIIKYQPIMQGSPSYGQKTDHSDYNKKGQKSFQRGRHNLSTTSYNSRPTLGPADKNPKFSQQRCQKSILQLQLKIQQQKLAQEQALLKLEQLQQSYGSQKIHKYQTCKQQLAKVEMRAQKQANKNAYKMQKIRQHIHKIIENLSCNDATNTPINSKTNLQVLKQIITAQIFLRYPHGVSPSSSSPTHHHSNKYQQNQASKLDSEEIIIHSSQFQLSSVFDSCFQQKKQKNKAKYYNQQSVLLTKNIPQKQNLSLNQQKPSKNSYNTKTINIDGIQTINDSTYFQNIQKQSPQVKTRHLNQNQNKNQRKQQLSYQHKHQQVQYQQDVEHEQYEGDEQSESILLDDSIFG